MKKLKIFSVVFFAAIMLGIGTGVVTVQAYKIPEQNHLAIGLSMLIQNKNSAVITPLNSETIARIENGSLTLQEIEEFKNTLQDSINQGFKKWQMQHLGELRYIGEPDNETAKSMLFSFLDQNPKYREQFKLYDQLLSLEIEQKIENITRQVHESFKNIDLIMEQGQLIREWNTTTTINGENCTAINRVYELEINGTTLTFIKVSIYSPDGAEIADPYGMLIANPLGYWTAVWVWIYWPWSGFWCPVYVCYGYDYLCYTRFPGEPSTEASLYYIAVLGVLYQEHESSQKLFGELASLAVNLAGAGPYGQTIAAILFTIAFTGGFLTEAWYNNAWQSFTAMWMYNYAKDPSFGFEIMQRLHLLQPQAWPVWDPVSFTTLHYVNVDGATVQVCPPSGTVLIINDAVHVYYFNMACATFAANYGTNNWVWVGPYEPIE